MTVQVPDREYTRIAESILTKSADVAVKFKSNEVQPLHLLLALLCGDGLDIDDFSRFSAPDDRTPLWSVVEDLDGNPLALARTIWQKISGSPSPSLAPERAFVANDRLSPPPKTKWGFGLPLRSRKNAAKEIPSPLSSGSPSPSTSHLDPNGDTAASPNPSDALTAVITRARKIKAESGDRFVAPHHLTLAITEDNDAKPVLETEVDSAASVASALQSHRQGVKVITQDDSQFEYLARYATDMCAMAHQGNLHDIVGRDHEIQRAIQVLSRKTKNSAILLGEPGVGKTAVVEGLAHRIATGQVPVTLRGTIYSLDIGSLFAGAAKGEYEQRVKGVMQDVIRLQQSGKPVILFIDEIHLITVGKTPGSQSSGMDAANLLKPELARGQFRCIGATTLAEYREYIEKDGALERRFTKIMVEEPTISEAITILRGIRKQYEEHHKVWIMDQAVVAAVTLAHRYLTSRRLPDSAVDLMDEACASAKVVQDMDPEAIDTLKRKIMHASIHIEALQRDNHPDDSAALSAVQKDLVDMEEKMRSLTSQQVKVKDWWAKIGIQRGSIMKEEEALGGSQGGTNKEQILKNLKALRDGLLKLENKGPDVSGSDSNNLGRHILPRMSPHTITSENIAAVVERATKIPVQKLLSTEKTRLRDLEEVLTRQVVGQPEAVKAVSNAIQVSRTKLGNIDQPVSLLFTGPSGTGKTLLCKALAEELFGQAKSMIRIDGSEYSESHSVSRLIGSPPGYVGFDQGGQLTEFVRRTPHCIILLDEIEKTCPQFLTLFLQVLDEGRLTDGQGRFIDFRNCVVIMTSNVGAEILQKERDAISAAAREAVMEEFRLYHFPIEFLNRIDEIVMFRTMSSNVLEKILEKHLKELEQREGIRKLKLDICRDAKSWLIKEGTSPEYGARPLARVIQKHLLNPLSHCLLNETFREGRKVFVDRNEQGDGLSIQLDQS